MPRSKLRSNRPDDEDSSEVLEVTIPVDKASGMKPDLQAFVVIVNALNDLDEEKRWAVLRAAEAYFQKLDRRGRDD